jgi:hypothetical protein
MGVRCCVSCGKFCRKGSEHGWEGPGSGTPPRRTSSERRGARLDVSDGLMFPAAGALLAPRKPRGWWLRGKLTEYPLWEVAGERDRWHQRWPLGPVLEGFVGIALSGDVAARPPLFCLHHFVDHRPKILTGFIP